MSVSLSTKRLTRFFIQMSLSRRQFNLPSELQQIYVFYDRTAFSGLFLSQQEGRSQLTGEGGTVKEDANFSGQAIECY